MVTNLSGATHSRFFSDTVCKRGGVPITSTVDGAAAWNAVKFQIGTVYDLRETTTVPIGDSVRLLLFF